MTSAKIGPQNIDRIVRFNSIVLMSHQAIVSTTIQTVISIGPLIMLTLSGSYVLGGLVSAITWGGRLVIVYTSGRLMDRLGRKKVLLYGTIPLILGLIVVVVAALLQHVYLLIAGLVVFGLGVGIANQNRIAISDMYPPNQRGKAIGKLYTSSVIGALMAPFIVFACETVSRGEPIMSAVTTWIVSGVLASVLIPLLMIIRVDPKEIGLLLQNAQGNNPHGNYIVQATFARSNYPLMVAFLLSALSQGNMVMMMGLTSLYLHDLGYSETLISTAVAIHTIGMFGFANLFGSLVDRWGRVRVLALGTVISGIGSIIIPTTHEHLIVDAGMFLIGLGWSASIVSSTSMISDIVNVAVRGRYFGLNDLFLGVSAVSLPLIGGEIASAGFLWVGALGFLMTAPFTLLVLKVREAAPGVYGPS